MLKGGKGKERRAILEVEEEESLLDNQKKQVRWSPSMDLILLDVLQEELLLGHRGDNGWKPEAFTHVRRVMKKKMGFDLTTSNVRNRLKTLKGNYHSAKKLIAESGLNWDCSTGMIIAEENVWMDYVKVHPRMEVLKWRSNAIPHYDQLALVIGNDVANGGGLTGVEADLDLELDVEMFDTAGNVGTLPDKDDDIGHTQPATSSSTAIPTCSSGKKKRSRRGDDGDEMAMLANAANRVAAALEARTATMAANEVDLVALNVEIKNIPGMSPMSVIKAVEFLGEDMRRARVFKALDEDQKRIWLKSRIEGL